MLHFGFLTNQPLSVWLYRSCNITMLFHGMSCSNISLSVSLPSASLSSLLVVFLLRSPVFLHALLDPAEDLSGDGKVTLLFIISSSYVPSFLSCSTKTLRSPGKGECVCAGGVRVCVCVGICALL